MNNLGVGDEFGGSPRAPEFEIVHTNNRRDFEQDVKTALGRGLVVAGFAMVSVEGERAPYWTALLAKYL